MMRAAAFERAALYIECADAVCVRRNIGAIDLVAVFPFSRNTVAHLALTGGPIA